MTASVAVTPLTDARAHNRYAPRMKLTYSRRTFLETSLIAGAVISAPRFAASAPSASSVPPKPKFPVADYHVHLSPTLTIDQVVALGKDRGVQIGILEHPGTGFPINTDGDLRHYIDEMRNYPVRIGMQAVYPGWSKSFSKNLLDELDYVLMDALTLPNPDGTFLAIWQIDTHVDDEEEFMARYMRFIEQVLTTESIDIFGWPTFLPVPIARQYSQLWTPQRVDRIQVYDKAVSLTDALDQTGCKERGVQSMNFNCTFDVANGTQTLLILPDIDFSGHKKANVEVDTVKCVEHCELLPPANP